MSSNVTMISRQQLAVPPITAEEEDAIINTRITNDERGLRRVMKKFHAYTSTSSRASGSAQPDTTSATEDAREAFLIELASFELSLRKNLIICEAEMRQVEEYERERRRIVDEHMSLRGQIDQLKTSLEHAQVVRKRKIEYDAVAEKINALPTRDELNLSIQVLEYDMATIRSEQDAQDRALQAQKAALHSVVSDMGALRLIGKDADALEVDTLLEQEATAGSTLEAGEEREEGETDGGSQTPAAASPLNPDAKAFVSVPGKPNAQTRAQQRLGVGLGIGRPASAAGSDAPPKQASSPLPLSSLPTKPTGGDIEMGEVAEVKAKRRKPREEELEEGEATDASSELSDPPDDL